MAWEEEWFRRWWKRFPFVPRGFFEDIDKMMDEAFKDMSKGVPKDLIRERKLPSGGVAREIGPLVYGYSIVIGPDGKPVIREFGNVKPSLKPAPLGLRRPGLEVTEEREPLTDVLEEKDVVRVVAEVPGVEKTDINLNCTEGTLTISVDKPKHKYFKEVELPAEVDPKTAKANYKHGVLEVIISKIKKKKPAKGKGVPIA